MANRKHSVRHLQRRRTYNVREAAKVTGATPGTVRNWQKNGLEQVFGVYPAIFRGVDIIAFLQRRNRARKQPCGPGRGLETSLSGMARLYSSERPITES